MIVKGIKTLEHNRLPNMFTFTQNQKQTFTLCFVPFITYIEQ